VESFSFLSTYILSQESTFMTINFWKKWSIEALYKEGAKEVLDRGYGDSGRNYHSWAHIADLLRKLDKFQRLATRGDLIAHAIYWHDVVYKTRSEEGTGRPDRENVQESADLFMQYSLLPEKDKQAVYEMIMATADHKNPKEVEEFYPGFKRDRNLLLDLDLSSFAGTWPDFKLMDAGVRHEFEWVSYKAFCAGRATILGKFAVLNPIYKTPELETLWGDQARKNLLRSSRIFAVRAEAL
jgi:predicted metal-dependent HD superfamily phosphohydrolase